MTREEKIWEYVENSTLSDDAKFYLRQFLQPTIRCCGRFLVNSNNEMCMIGTPEGQASLGEEINASGIATATSRTVARDPRNGRIKWYLVVRFLPVLERIKN